MKKDTKAAIAIKPMKVQPVRIPYRPVTDDKLWELNTPDNNVTSESVLEIPIVEIPETLVEKLNRRYRMNKERVKDYLKSSYWKKRAKKKEVDQFYNQNEKSVSW